MKIHEYQAKDILARYGIPVQPGKVAATPEEAEAIARELGGPVVVKSPGLCWGTREGGRREIWPHPGGGARGRV